MVTKKSLEYEDLFNIQIESLVEIDNFKSEFICVICLGIVIKPLQLKCCDHLICTRCLKMYIKSNHKILRCPLCNKSLAYESPNKIIRRLHSNLLIKCKNLKCEKTIRYEEYFNHIFNECQDTEEIIKNKLKYCKKCEDIYESKSEENDDNVQSIDKENLSGREDINKDKKFLTKIHECMIGKLVKEYKDDK